jgi:hypothetical protein
MRILRRLLVLCTFLALPALCPAGSFSNGSAAVSCPSSGNEQLTSTQLIVAWAVIQAPAANTGNVYFGGSGVTTSNGVYIVPGGSLNLPPRSNTAAFNLSGVYMACTQSGDSVTYIYAQ